MAQKPHHHGNLRPALIKAGIELLATEGIDGMTLRKVAALAGVSHAAPAHHFAGKHGLTLAIAAFGFQTFSALMQEERYRNGAGPQDQLLGICAGYLRFAAEHDALFRLIFTSAIKENPDKELQAASLAAFQILVDVCTLFEPSALGAGVNEIRVWSLVHGYAGLSRFSHLRSPVSGEIIPFSALLPEMTPRRME
jgi:AcrR family transcriptional regulator